ncbi:Uncharacterised protein [Mycobacteroides abscessus subsp. abscessus]|nr:Uncharacterised protein [Mycobacteroides abscessus subsp. abscessus]
MGQVAAILTFTVGRVSSVMAIDGSARPGARLWWRTTPGTESTACSIKRWRTRS